MNYTSKIQNLKSLVDIRKKKCHDKWIMVHGVFDLVHPGHIRHLRFAKEKGDILIASITSDEHVAKGEDRPYINQELRAENLAALEIVDYVVINDFKTPISILKSLKPDIFVKGSEYAGNRLDAKERTLEEKMTVESYGGKMIYSPGDVVFSSTKILDKFKPKIENEKLRTILEAQKIDKEYFMNILDGFPKRKVLVVGDTIIDKYTYCVSLGKTTKTPTLSIKHDYSEVFLGGAAIVAKHVHELGGNVGFLTLLGDDDNGKKVTKEFAESDIKFSYAVDELRPTTEKERFWAESYKLLQVDKVENEPMSTTLLDEFLSEYKNLMGSYDVVVFSDFRHGIFTKKTIQEFVDIAKSKNKIIIADTQVSNRWGNIADYKNIDLICPNEAEARFALGNQDVGVLQLGRWLLRETKCTNLILKLGERGLIAYEKPIGKRNPNKIRDYYPIPSFGKKVIDAVGTGDALLASTSLSLTKDTNVLAIGIIANCAAAKALEQMGNSPVPYQKIKEFTEQKLKEIFD